MFNKETIRLESSANTVRVIMNDNNTLSFHFGKFRYLTTNLIFS